MNLTHRFLKTFNEVATYVNVYFENFFWDDMTNEDLFDSYIKSGCKFVLFEDNGTPVGLLVFKVHEDPDAISLLKDKYEILLFEVSDRTCGKGRGFGEDIIKYFKDNIATERDICGYSLGQSAPFWKKVSTKVDEEVYEYLKEYDFEGEVMMYFNISH